MSSNIRRRIFTLETYVTNRYHQNYGILTACNVLSAVDWQRDSFLLHAYRKILEYVMIFLSYVAYISSTHNNLATEVHHVATRNLLGAVSI